MSLYAIVVAGGSGSRMHSNVSKQFIAIGGQPILMHTIRKFHQFASDTTILVVLPEKEIPFWDVLCKEHSFNIPHIPVAGGKTRFQSVQNGLNAITDDKGLVAIHDGVRPFVSLQTIKRSFDVAKEKGCAISVVALKDSIRLLQTEGNSQSVNRTNFCLVQTPQTFQVALIKQSFLHVTHTNFTDDASVAEAAGFTVHLIEGSYENIKITTPEDLLWAEAFLIKQISV